MDVFSASFIWLRIIIRQLRENECCNRRIFERFVCICEKIVVLICERYVVCSAVEIIFPALSPCVCLSVCLTHVTKQDFFYRIYLHHLLGHRSGCFVSYATKQKWVFFSEHTVYTSKYYDEVCAR